MMVRARCFLIFRGFGGFGLGGFTTLIWFPPPPEVADAGGCGGVGAAPGKFGDSGIPL